MARPAAAKLWDVVVVGAGPAGLMAAMASAEEGAKTLVLERARRLGGKLPFSGGGRGNLSHVGDLEELLRHYHGGKGPKEAARFLCPALHVFSNQDLCAFFTARGLPIAAEEDGRLFPQTGRARDALAVLISELHRLGVVASPEADVQAIRKNRGIFCLRVSGQPKVGGKALVLAIGGRARNPHPHGYVLAASLGHRITPLKPALVPLRIVAHAFAPFSACAGIALRKVRVGLRRGGRELCHKEGDVLFTHQGLSGPAILDLSREVEPGDVVAVTLAPGISSTPEAENRLLRELIASGKAAVVNILRALGLPRNLACALLQALGADSSLPAAQLPRPVRKALARSLGEGHPFPVAAVGSWEEAMVTRGGVALEEVDPKTMGSRGVPGLFFAGEILDIDGESGGYNLQAAFSTGYLAGKSAAAFAQKREGRSGLGGIAFSA